MTWEQIREIVKSRKWAFIAILVLVLANIAMAVYSRFIQQPALVRLQQEWSEKRLLLTGSKGDLTTIYRQGEADLAAFQQRIPLKRDFTRVMMEVFELASNNGLKVKGITYKPEPIKESNLVTYGVVMTLDGKYAGIKSFISDLQCYGGLVTMDSISLSSNSRTEEEVSLKMQLSAYLRTEGK